MVLLRAVTTDRLIGLTSPDSLLIQRTSSMTHPFEDKSELQLGKYLESVKKYLLNYNYTQSILHN